MLSLAIEMTCLISTKGTDNLKNIIFSKICQNCGECCKHFPFIKLPQDEIEVIEQYTGLNSASFMNAIGTPEDGYFLKFKENGSCIFLEESKHKYSCSIYEVRSELCRNYPSNPVQDKACIAKRQKVK